MPALDDSVKVKIASFKIPLIVWKYFYASLRQVSIKIRNGLSQCTPGAFLRQQLGDHPQAELVVFQAGLEIGDQRVEQILFSLVEVAEVCSPGHVAHDADSSLS